MRIDNIKATNIDLTDAIRSYVEEKLLGLAKFTSVYGSVANCDVEVGKMTEHHNKGKHFKCEVNMQIPGDVLRVDVIDESLYAAIDKAKDELKRQLVERANRQKTKQRRDAKAFKDQMSVMGMARDDE